MDSYGVKGELSMYSDEFNDVHNFAKDKGFKNRLAIAIITSNSEKRVGELVDGTFGYRKVNFTFQDVIDDTVNAINKLIEDEVFDRVQNEMANREKYKVFNRR